MHLTNSVTNSVVGTDFNSLDKESILSKSYNFSHALSPLCMATVVDTLQSGWQSLLLQDIENIIPIPDKCNISASSGRPPPYNWGLNARVFSFMWFLSERRVRASYAVWMRALHYACNALPAYVLRVLAALSTAGLSYTCMHWRHAIPRLYDGLRKWKFTGESLWYAPLYYNKIM